MTARARAPRSKGSATPVTPEVIKDVAIKLFSEKGYPVIGMRDISEAVGILPGSLYAHITGKEALLLDIVKSGVDNFTEAIAPIVATDGPADVRLREAIRAHMRVLAVTLDQTRVTFHQWHYLTGDNRLRMLEARQRYEHLFRSLLDDGVEDRTLRDAARRKISALTIIGILGSATEWFSPSGSGSPEEVGDAMADVVLLGLLRSGGE
jgi:AcrR family transcriptional regulator